MRLSAVSRRRLERTSAVNECLFSNVFKQLKVSQQKVWAHGDTC